MKKSNKEPQSLHFQRDLEEANKLIFIRSYAAAKEILTRLLAEHKTSLLLHLRYVELEIKIGAIDELRRFYQQQEDKLVQEAGKLMIEQFCGEHNPTTLIKHCRALIRKYGESAFAWYGIAFNQERLGDYDRAVSSYEKSIELDPDWYPSYFGLSQICYQKQAWQEGDSFFHMFEQIAPYNVYGNFDTHRRLYSDFFAQGKYDEALEAIECLVQWWLESQRTCPPEILLYRRLSRARIAAARGDTVRAKHDEEQARAQIDSFVSSKNSSEDALLFVAAVCKEFALHDCVFAIYTELLKRSGSNPDNELIQEIGDFYLSAGHAEDAVKLFERVYDEHPDHENLRLWLLIARLRTKKVDVEDYLACREKMQQMVKLSADRLELLNLMHSMLARFDSDAEVHRQLGMFYAEMKSKKKTRFYLQRMYHLDRHGSNSKLTWAAFLLKNEEVAKGQDVLTEIKDVASLPPERQVEFHSLQAAGFAAQKDFNRATEAIKKALNLNPWHVSSLIGEIYYLTHLYYEQHKIKNIDNSVVNLSESFEFEPNEFLETTNQFLANKLYYLAYTRARLYFLYQRTEDALRCLIMVGCAFSPDTALRDVTRLLNTNYDSALVYYALGIFGKECWQHEVASMWLNLALQRPDLTPDLQGDIYLELADCYVWQNQELSTAIEYTQLSLKRSFINTERALRILGHAWLRQGDMDRARSYLQRIDSSKADDEGLYLKGLLEYHRGDEEQAFAIWKPLLQRESENLRFHNIKQEVLKFYGQNIHTDKAS